MSMEGAEQVTVHSIRGQTGLYTSMDSPAPEQTQEPNTRAPCRLCHAIPCTASALSSRGRTHTRYAHKLHPLCIAPCRIGDPCDMLYCSLQPKGRYADTQPHSWNENSPGYPGRRLARRYYTVYTVALHKPRPTTACLSGCVGQHQSVWARADT
ncbi:hypothetical protein BDU57DRAFT_356797 [Ampelomyces quisqualis]|uniref:Uncharacterized protein n=1 Tax=Ampelomyces quisqualis TaxID=50730 RepID=A0A6A5QBR9_AMPQU|nr:hypothetical protein BDU57DRAFT_356797 [Ampelomyces quisqualis]